MKADIHPAYERIEVTCSCGNHFETGSALCTPLHVEVCNACHPFYTGKQKVIDTAGRVDKFAKRFGNTFSDKEKTHKDADTGGVA